MVYLKLITCFQEFNVSLTWAKDHATKLGTQLPTNLRKDTHMDGSDQKRLSSTQPFGLFNKHSKM